MATILVARSRNRVIGINGELPWHIPHDLARFKQLTVGSTVIMGRKTFDSIGRPLPDRENVVLSRDPHFRARGVQVFTSFEQCLDVLLSTRSTTQLRIIGGEQVYAKALELDCVNHIELTLVNRFIENGDAFFPLTPPTHWQIVGVQLQREHDELKDQYAFITYARRMNKSTYKPLLYLPAARFDDQYDHMQDILNDGLCPFCYHYIRWYHENTVEAINDHWLLTKNDNPYAGTLHDLLLIPVEHVTTFGDLSVASQAAFATAIAQVEARFELKHFAVGMRSGDMTRTGGSVAHLHAHIKVGDVDNPDHRPIRFKMSSIPEENI